MVFVLTDVACDVSGCHLRSRVLHDGQVRLFTYLFLYVICGSWVLSVVYEESTARGCMWLYPVVVCVSAVNVGRRFMKCEHFVWWIVSSPEIVFCKVLVTVVISSVVLVPCGSTRSVVGIFSGQAILTLKQVLPQDHNCERVFRRHGW